MAAGTKPPQPPVRYCPHSAGGGAELVEASEQELQEEEPLGESAVLAAPQLPCPGLLGRTALGRLYLLLRTASFSADRAPLGLGPWCCRQRVPILRLLHGRWRWMKSGWSRRGWKESPQAAEGMATAHTCGPLHATSIAQPSYWRQEPAR